MRNPFGAAQRLVESGLLASHDLPVANGPEGFRRKVETIAACYRTWNEVSTVHLDALEARIDVERLMRHFAEDTETAGVLRDMRLRLIELEALYREAAHLKGGMES